MEQFSADLRDAGTRRNGGVHATTEPETGRASSSNGTGRLIVVSNRVAVPTPGSTQAGGLAVAVRSLLKRRPGVWFGWSGKNVER